MLLNLVNGSFLVAQVRNLGGILDPHSRWRSVLPYIWNLSSSSPLLSWPNTIICHLDYCISLINDLYAFYLCPSTVCSVYNSENHLFKMKDHVTHLLKICHWFPSSYRIRTEIFPWLVT